MSLALLLATELEVDLETGFEVFGISAPGPFVDRIEALGVRHVPIPSLTRAWSPRSDQAAARELWRALRQLDLDVLHTHNPKTGVMGRVLGRLAGVPVVVNTCHGLWATAEDPWLKRALVHLAEAFAGRFTDAELYQNDDDRRRLSRAVGRSRQRTVGNGIDLSRFRPDPASRVRVRRELGVSDGEVLVGGVGRRVVEKGVLEYAAAARQLAGRARFVWVGPADGDKLDAVEADPAGVDFLGLRHDVEAIYAALDVFVLPSRREGFSRSAMEAAASGCALVLSDIRGCRQIGAHERELLLVPPRDVPALASAIERLLAEPRLRQRLGAAARRRALARFDQRVVAAASIETYRRAAERKGIRWPVVSST
ncbi:MAG: glycosyltransferase family 4 protein [Nitriliruptorales bacterium]|nr:glycosyltransferase family 4 protein [Nitriliruptorales bacterium]